MNFDFHSSLILWIVNIDSERWEIVTKMVHSLIKTSTTFVKRHVKLVTCRFRRPISTKKVSICSPVPSIYRTGLKLEYRIFHTISFLEISNSKIFQIYFYWSSRTQFNRSSWIKTSSKSFSMPGFSLLKIFICLYISFKSQLFWQKSEHCVAGE